MLPEKPSEEIVNRIARWIYETEDFMAPWDSPKTAKVRSSMRKTVRTVLEVKGMIDFEDSRK